MNLDKPRISVLLLGGPGDGAHCDNIVATERTIYYPSQNTDTVYTYAVQALVDVSGVHYVATRDSNACPIRMLLAGYRNSKPHHSDENVIEQMVLILGGKADGKIIVLPTGRTAISAGELGDAYRVIDFAGKDRKHYRVAVLNVLGVDPIKMLIEGYRK